MQVNYDKLPPHMQYTARLYVESGVPGGSFFMALVSNDLMGAFGRADRINSEAMRDWVMWLYNDAPSPCHGSPELVAAWVRSGGLARAAAPGVEA